MLTCERKDGLSISMPDSLVPPCSVLELAAMPFAWGCACPGGGT